MEPARLIAAFVLCAVASAQDAGAPRAGVAALKEAERVFAAGNPEQARVEVERAIAEMLAARPEARDAEDDRALRDAGALAYKLRSMEPARRAWDAVRRYREKTLDPTSLELQNARGNVSWIGEQMGLVDEARVLEEHIVAALEKTQPADSDALATARGNLGDTLLQQGEAARALELFTQVANVRRVKLPDGHPQRLRTELDVACGLAATGDRTGGERITMDVLGAAAADAFPVRMRAHAALALSVGSRRDPEPGADGFALTGLLDTFDPAFRAAARQIVGLDWRAAEIRTAELRPILDVLISAHFAFGTASAPKLRRPPGTTGLTPPEPYQSVVEYHRWERTRIETDGTDRRVVADERLVALASGVGWIDLGPLADVRLLVQAWCDAAQHGDARVEAHAVASTLFAPVAAALGNPRVLSIVPDDVIWAVPLHALDLRTDEGRAVTVEAVLWADVGHESVPTGPWVAFGDPAGARAGDAAKSPPNRVGSGAAAAFVAGAAPATSEATAAWARRLGVEAVTKDDATLERFVALADASAGVVLTAPLWSAPDAVPCVDDPRPIVASTPLAAAMAREDVFGGSSPADLCGIRFADHARAAAEDRRVPGSPRAADLRELAAKSGRRLVVASPPPRADVVLRARDIEALAHALVAAGFVDVCFATQAVRDVERVTFPYEIEALIPRATTVPAGTVPGPWLRVRAVPR